MEKLIEVERTDPDKSPKISSKSILQSICTGDLYGQVIGKIASSLQYTSVDTRIIELADVLNRRGVLNGNEDIAAVGVVDRQGSTLGLIDRRELFGTLGRQFGRDIYSTKTVDKVMRQVKTYDQNRNIFSVADDLQEELHDTNTKYFLITRDDTQFAGIFSTKDLLVYLSKITQIDISMARKIQNQIVHEEQFVASSKFNLLASSRMAKGVGGDFYFLKEYSKGRWIIILCDVSGKGVSASLVTAVLGGMLEVYDFSQGIHRFIIKLNKYMINTFAHEKFLTGLFIEYVESSNRLKIYDMGHSYLYIIRGKKFFRLKTGKGNLPIGITQELEPVSDILRLNSGELLIMLTDGLIEQVNEAGKEFGNKRISEIIKENNRAKNLKTTKDILFDEINRFRGTMPQHDDMTIIMLATQSALLNSK